MRLSIISIMMTVIILFAVTVARSQIVPPKLISPADGERLTYAYVTALWSSVNNALRYRLQISTDSTFSMVIPRIDTTLTDTSWSGLLQTRTTYYWRVNASNRNQTSPWSLVWDFTTGIGAAVIYDMTVPKTVYIRGPAEAVQYGLPEKCNVSLQYFDLKGRLVGTLVNGVQGPGSYTVMSKDLPAASYARVFQAGTFSKTETVTVK